MINLLFRCLVSLVPLATDLLGLAYPCLGSAKAAIQEDAEASSTWLSYWTVYAAVKFFEVTCEWVISWLPMYPEMKLAFVCWLVLPRYQGARLIFERIVSPYFLQYEDEIDSQLLLAQVEARKHVWTFSIYLLTEGSKMAGEKTMAAVGLFLRLAGLSLGTTVVEDQMIAVASAMGQAVDKGLGEVASKSLPKPTATAGEIHATSNSKEVDEAAEEFTEGEGWGVRGEDCFGLDDAENLSAEEAGLLVDFLSIMNDGVYLNVSSNNVASAQRSIPLLRIVTLSKDRWRLLWTNLRDLRSRSSVASSLHLCTVRCPRRSTVTIKNSSSSSLALPVMSPYVPVVGDRGYHSPRAVRRRRGESERLVGDLRSAGPGSPQRAAGGAHSLAKGRAQLRSPMPQPAGQLVLTAVPAALARIWLAFACVCWQEAHRPLMRKGPRAAMLCTHRTW